MSETNKTEKKSAVAELRELYWYYRNNRKPSQSTIDAVKKYNEEQAKKNNQEKQVAKPSYSPEAGA